MGNVRAMVLIPTTGNRGKLLPYSVGSIQNQTIKEIEIFIVGDGVTKETREIIRKLIDEDSRIQFFDFPKHERRGEIYRHKILQKARGEFVCYLCDRDLMLPDHLETMESLLREYNFVSTTYIDVKEDQTLNIDQYIEYYGAAVENDQSLVQLGAISLSNVAHTRKLYHDLPFGWRTTPEDEYTDVYMWKQFMAHPDCNAWSHTKPTILYFKRGDFPGKSVEKREKELSVWSKKIKNEADIQRIKDEAFQGLLNDRLQLRFRLRSYFLLKGYTLSEALQKAFQKVSNLLKRP